MKPARSHESTSAQKRAEPLEVCLLWRHPLVATGFRARLEGERFAVTDIRIKGDTFPPAGTAFPPNAPLVVVDSEGGSALPVLAQLEALSPSARTIVLGELFEDEASTFKLLRAGVKGLLTYAEIPARLPQALEAVAAGGFWVPRALLSRFVEDTVKTTPRQRPAGEKVLTLREEEILPDLLLNLSNKEIAHKRHLTSRTVKFHVSNVLAKYGVKRRADLLLLSFPQH